MSRDEEFQSLRCAVVPGRLHSGRRGQSHSLIDLFADHFTQVFGTDVVASIVAKSASGIHTEATIDPVALFGLHAADHGHFVF
jgi:hypothetical protein